MMLMQVNIAGIFGMAKISLYRSKPFKNWYWFIVYLIGLATTVLKFKKKMNECWFVAALPRIW